MRYIVGPLLIVGSLAACAGVPKPVPKTSPSEVRLIDPRVGQEADEGYLTIGPVRAMVPLSTSVAELSQLLRNEGAALGADAVILRRIRRTTEGEAEGEVGLTPSGGGMVAKGVAIYYPRAEPPK